jgi:hypothetical protein
MKTVKSGFSLFESLNNFQIDATGPAASIRSNQPQEQSLNPYLYFENNS